VPSAMGKSAEDREVSPGTTNSIYVGHATMTNHLARTRTVHLRVRVVCKRHYLPFRSAGLTDDLLDMGWSTTSVWHTGIDGQCVAA